MAALKDIRRKIKGIQKTRQITKAMNMVAAAKFKSSHAKMENFRVYARGIAALVASLVGKSEWEENPLFRHPATVRRVRLVLFSSDRGLCGGFNNNLFKFAQQIINREEAAGREVIITAVGRKGWEFFRKKKVPLMPIPGDGESELSLAKNLAQNLMDSVLKGETDEVYLLFNRFLHVSMQKPTSERFLPLAPDTIGVAHFGGEYIWEPSLEQLINEILPIYLTARVEQVLLETQAGENGARMVAMDNATKNCDEMNRVLTLKLNKARQAAITAELMDIVGGAEALAQS